MRLIPNWRAVATRAYSAVFSLLAFLAGALAVLRDNTELLAAAGLPPQTIAWLSIACALAAYVGRLIEQPSLPKEDAP